MLAVENFGRLLLKSTGGLADLYCRIKIFSGQNIGCEPLNLPKFSTAKILCYTVLPRVYSGAIMYSWYYLHLMDSSCGGCVAKM